MNPFGFSLIGCGGLGMKVWGAEGSHINPEPKPYTSRDPSQHCLLLP